METTQVKPEVNTPASTPALPKKFTPPKKRGWVKWVRRLVILAVLAGGVVFLLASASRRAPSWRRGPTSPRRPRCGI